MNQAERDYSVAQAARFSTEITYGMETNNSMKLNQIMTEKLGCNQIIHTSDSSSSSSPAGAPPSFPPLSKNFVNPSNVLSPL